MVISKSLTQIVLLMTLYLTSSISPETFDRKSFSIILSQTSEKDQFLPNLNTCTQESMKLCLADPECTWISGMCIARADCSN